MLLATGTEIIGNGPAAIGALVRAARGPVSQRLLRRMAAAAFLMALFGVGVAFPIL